MSETMKSDGGPAFPQHDLSSYGIGPAMRGYVPGEEESGRYEVEGMSLRDWFAGQAINGLLSAGVGTASEKIASDAAYRVADAMLSRRGK